MGSSTDYVTVDEDSPLFNFVSKYQIRKPELVKIIEFFAQEDKVTLTSSIRRHTREVPGLTTVRKDIRVKLEGAKGEISYKRVNYFDKKMFLSFGFKTSEDVYAYEGTFARIYTLNKPKSNSKVYSYYGLYPLEKVSAFDFLYIGLDPFKCVVFIQDEKIEPISKLVDYEGG